MRGRCGSEGERWEGDVVVKVRVRVGGRCGGEGEGWEGDVVVRERGGRVMW